ncbi:hypothetical protein fugu_014955 [Takifugu bimaculatus]|uniref:Sulfotransferase n=1 Tax=Takifugu bimaculatus TaxID=433685 RepID=A0A4Z2BXF3_9TELE|nr:hypothetical protein fugu_014955 [Takifugu bimaculatus]
MRLMAARQEKSIRHFSIWVPAALAKAQHHITQINGCGCEGRTAPSLWSLIKGTCDMFIRVYVSVHALAAQVIRKENSLTLVLNQTKLRRFDHQDGKMEPEKDLQATDSLREDVVAVGLRAELDVGQPDVQLQRNAGQEDLKSAVSINQAFKELWLFYFNCMFGLSARNLGDDLRKFWPKIKRATYRFYFKGEFGEETGLEPPPLNLIHTVCGSCAKDPGFAPWQRSDAPVPKCLVTGTQLFHGRPMEYSLILQNLHVVPSSHVKNKLFLFCIMLSLWGYMIYCCVGYCSTVPNLAHGSVSRHHNAADTDNTESSLGASRDLLNNENDLDGKGEEWDEIRGEVKALDDNAMSGFLNESESKKLPQAIIIGVKKGGTRALLEFLRLHPDIRAVGAEPHFFDRNYDKGLEWYRELMPTSSDGQLTMEKTPSYYVTKDVPARIHTMSKYTKLIVVVRDPVTRAISDYTQTRSKKPDIPSFESLTFKNLSAGLIDTTWSAVQIGMYAKHLERWLQYFPMEQLLFVSGERLISDPRRGNGPRSGLSRAEEGGHGEAFPLQSGKRLPLPQETRGEQQTTLLRQNQRQDPSKYRPGGRAEVKGLL